MESIATTAHLLGKMCLNAYEYKITRKMVIMNSKMK